MKIKIGGQFSGVGAFDFSLKKLGIDFSNLMQVEIDKYARQSYLANHGEKSDIFLLKHPDVKFCDDIYHRYINRKLDRPTISEYKKLLQIQEKTARLFSFYYPWNVKYIQNINECLDLAMLSPPCQSFSLAGKRGGKEDLKGRGILFFNSLEFISINKPRFFIFENVKGLLSADNGTTFGEWVRLLGGKSVNGNTVMFPEDDAVPYHIYYQVLNAKHYGVPQNRERVFIVGIRDDQDNDFYFPKKIPLTKRLKDVLESKVDEKYYLSEKMLELISYNNKEKGIVANLNKGGQKGEVFAKNSDYISCLTATDYKQPKQIIDTPKVIHQLTGGKWDKTHEQSGRVYDVEAIAPTIHTMGGGNQEPKILQKARGFNEGGEHKICPSITCNSWQENNHLLVPVIGAMRGRNPDNLNDRKAGCPTVKTLEINHNGTSNALTTVQKDNYVIIPETTKKGYAKVYNGDSFYLDRPHQKRGVVQKEMTATIKTSGNDLGVFIENRIRKLTPTECFRLMGMYDIKQVCSDSQLYKQAGNSIVVDVLAAIISKLKLTSNQP